MPKVLGICQVGNTSKVAGYYRSENILPAFNGEPQVSTDLK